MAKVIVMFSGGLDSVCASHLLKSMGHEVIGLHFVLPFTAGLGIDHVFVKKAAETIGMPLRIIEEGEEYLSVMRNPRFGFGSNANPCIDCRARRMRVAKKIMEEEGACCVATGEVIGQRPMSQRRDTMAIIQKSGELGDRLLRPLCAKKLEPTRPELEGLIDREQLLDWQGRGRKPQLAYAKEHGLFHGAPGGGCFLTENESATRFADLTANTPDWNLSDFKLLYWGRRFRISPATLLLVGRNEDENPLLLRQAGADDFTLLMSDMLGPLGLIRGIVSDEDLASAVSIFARYSKAKALESTRVSVLRHGETRILAIRPADEAFCSSKRV